MRRVVAAGARARHEEVTEGELVHADDGQRDQAQGDPHDDAAPRAWRSCGDDRAPGLHHLLLPPRVVTVCLEFYKVNPRGVSLAIQGTH